MDAQINITIKDENQNPENYLNYGQDCQNSEVSHSSENNLESESLDTHIKEEQQTAPIKEELAIVNEIIYQTPQDESVLNDFLWPSYLKREPVNTEDGSEVGTEDGSGEKSQFNEIQKSKYPLVLLKDLKHTHKKILEQFQSKDYKRRLRQKRPIRYCSFENDESLHLRKKLRSRLSQKTHSEELTDDEDDVTVSSGNDNCKDSFSWNKENNFLLKNKSENRCHRNETFVITSSKLKSQSTSHETKSKELFNAQCAKHTQKKLFKCDHCDYVTKYKWNFKCHNLKCCSKETELNSTEVCVIGVQSINKKLCSLSLTEIMLLIYNNWKLLNENTSIPSSTEVLKCSECNFETESQKYLEFHSQIHSKVQKCPECSHESTDTEIFKLHLITHLDHSTSTNYKKLFDAQYAKQKITKLFKCDYCDYETKFKRYFKRHNLKCRPKETELNSSEVCVIDVQSKNRKFCSLSLSEIMLLVYNNRKSVDENTSVPSLSEPLKCLECSFETENSKCLEFHSQIHAEVMKCPECIHESTDKETFKDHLINHLEHENIKAQEVGDLNNTKFICFDCSFETKSKELFNAHCAKHENTELFKCDCCQFETNFFRDFICHNLECSKKVYLNSKQNCVTVDHSKNTQFGSLSLSEIMLLIYNNRKSLDENTSVPSSTEPLKCSVCNFETESQKYLEFHSQIHSKVQKCPECSHESTDTDTFKEHLITHLDHSTSVSKSAPYSFRKRSRPSSKTVSDEPSDEEDEISESHTTLEASDFEDEMSDIEEEDTLENDKPRRRKKFKCRDCSYATYQNQYFLAHCLNHAKEKLFQCEHCKFKTNYRHTIKLHNMKCLKNPENGLSKCLSITDYEIRNYPVLPLSEIINLICSKDKSLDLNTSDQITIKALKCLDCAFVTGDLKFLNLHSQIHVDVKKCTDCSFESKDTETFKDHLISHFKHNLHLNRKMYKGKNCSSETNYKSFNPQCAKHTQKKLFKCDHCDYVTKYKWDFKCHNLKCRSKETELNSSEVCVIGVQSKNKKLCSLSLTEIMLLIYNNWKLLNENTSIPSATEVLKCSECNFETESQKYLEFHSQIHSKVQKCPECSHESTDTEIFKLHLITHLDHSTSTNYKKLFDAQYAKQKITKLFKCDYCDYETKFKRYFKRHNLKCRPKETELNSSEVCVIDVQSKNRKFCSLSLSEIMLLVYNNRTSVDENTSVPSLSEPLKCLECSFETENSKCLEFHSQIHAEVMKCPECSHKSTDSEMFKGHLTTHLGHSSSESQSDPFSSKKRPRQFSKTAVDDSTCEEHNEITNIHKLQNSDFENVMSHSIVRSANVQKKKEYKCDLCKFQTELHSNFVSHLLLHKENSDIGNIKAKLKNLKVYSLSEIISRIYNDEEIKQDINLNSNTKLHKCSHCNFECNDKEQLSQHHFSHSRGKFICSNCSSECSKENELDSHLSTRFICSKCTNERPDVATLNLHSCESNSDKVFKCSRCDFESKKEKHFTLHSQIHAKLKKCTECNYQIRWIGKFKVHLLSHLQSKLYTCSECTHKTNYIKPFKTHLLNHTGTRIFQCNKCNYKTNKKFQFKVHLENHLEFKTYRCSECDYSTVYPQSLKIHVLNHSEKKQFFCSVCNYGSNDKDRMKQHLLLHSDEKSYKCSKCDFETNYSRHLKNHEATRHGGRYLYACSHCDFKCYNSSTFRRHSLIHTDTKLYKCPECSYECNANLKLHIQNMHSKTKMYKCSECSYEGNHRSNFLTHIRTHSNERKYSCSECSFTSNRKDNLKIHMTTHLKKKLFKCADCPYECSNKYRFTQHVLKH